MEFDGDLAGRSSAGELMTGFVAAWRDAGIPEGLEVWHQQASDGRHVFYFSSDAARLVTDLLNGLRVIPYKERPMLDGFTKIKC